MFNFTNFTISANRTRTGKQAGLALLSGSAAQTGAVTVKLTGQYLIGQPTFLSGDRLELVVSTQEAGGVQSQLAASMSPGAGHATIAAGKSSDRTVIRFNQWRFFKMAYRLQPDSRLTIEGKPFATTGPGGEPILVVECSRLAIERQTRSLSLSWLGLCWVIIAVLLLGLLLLTPRLMPPGLILLTVLLGLGRLVDLAGLIPVSLKPKLKGWLVKILLGFGVLVAIWLFVQYSYYTTPRFR
ncbi:MAG TPA: hypothetical protein VH186_23215 [Chloroflexia bacterium]|nr:hypothetical protein [Chloroflexia bacterium]